jgi:hypothetical protein
MRNIVKGTEPQSLTQHRMTDPTDYDGYPDKEGLRSSLVAEQRGICRCNGVGIFPRVASGFSQISSIRAGTDREAPPEPNMPNPTGIAPPGALSLPCQRPFLV